MPNPRAGQAPGPTARRANCVAPPLPLSCGPCESGNSFPSPPFSPPRWLSWPPAAATPRQAPAASAAPAPAADTNPADQKSWLARSGDAARAVVTTPVRWFTPSPKKPATQAAPIIYEAPDAVIVPRDGSAGPGVIIVPAAPPDAPVTPPATQP